MFTEINTYLGIADSDYSAKKDEADFTVYGLKKSGKVHVMDKADDGKSYVSFKVSGEDFDVSKVEEDDAYLFTVAAGEVQTFVPAGPSKGTGSLPSRRAPTSPLAAPSMTSAMLLTMTTRL